MSRLQEFQTARTQLKNKLESVDWQLKGVFQNSEIKNSHDMIELQIERLKMLDRLRYFRPCKEEDIAYRQTMFETFPSWVMQNVSDDMRLVFHGTTLANTERILKSGRIISGKDRWSIHTSGDDAGEFSVSTKDYLEISMHYHMDMVETYRDYERFVPAGCLFVLQLDEPEYQFAKKEQRIHNVQLTKNSEKLYAIITTPENQNKVKWWAQKNNFPSDIVLDFSSFQEKIEQENIFFYLINRSNQKQ